MTSIWRCFASRYDGSISASKSAGSCSTFWSAASTRSWLLLGRKTPTWISKCCARVNYSLMNARENVRRAYKQRSANDVGKVRIVWLWWRPVFTFVARMWICLSSPDDMHFADIICTSLLASWLSHALSSMCTHRHAYVDRSVMCPAHTRMSVWLPGTYRPYTLISGYDIRSDRQCSPITFTCGFKVSSEQFEGYVCSIKPRKWRKSKLELFLFLLFSSKIRSSLFSHHRLALKIHKNRWKNAYLLPWKLCVHSQIARPSEYLSTEFIE